jgi:hypothetical protein
MMAAADESERNLSLLPAVFRCHGHGLEVVLGMHVKVLRVPLTVSYTACTRSSKSYYFFISDFTYIYICLYNRRTSSVAEVLLPP